MKELDHNLIRPFCKNLRGNKQSMAENSNSILKWFLDYQRNYEEYIRTAKSYYSASSLLSDNNWLMNREKTLYDVKITSGMLLAVDFGKSYGGECGYIHTALCLDITGNKVFVVPMTTVVSVVNSAYHPIDNPSGNRSLWLGRIEDGFTEKSALNLRDAKYVSIGRIIGDFSCVDDNITSEIKMCVMKALFSTQVNTFIQNVSKLEKANEKLRFEKEELRRENQSLKDKNKNLALKSN